MARETTITVALPEDALAYLESKQRESGLSPSEVVLRALEHLRREDCERQRDEQFARGWRERPETEDEFGWVEAASLGVLAELPWDGRDGEGVEDAEGGSRADGEGRDLVGKSAETVGETPGLAGGAQ